MQVEGFLEVARRGSVSRAAEALFITQPTLTARLHGLERELGTPLFLRTPHGMRLTEEKIIPAYKERSGFRGYILLTEPEGGERAMAITLWETEEDRDSSAGVARAMIGELKDVLRAPPKTENYEVRFFVQG